jgi:hypothetical protein
VPTHGCRRLVPRARSHSQQRRVKGSGGPSQRTGVWMGPDPQVVPLAIPFVCLLPPPVLTQPFLRQNCWENSSGWSGFFRQVSNHLDNRSATVTSSGKMHIPERHVSSLTVEDQRNADATKHLPCPSGRERCIALRKGSPSPPSPTPSFQVRSTSPQDLHISRGRRARTPELGPP